MATLWVIAAVTLALFCVLIWTMLKEKDQLAHLAVEAREAKAAVNNAVYRRNFTGTEDDLVRETLPPEDIESYVAMLASDNFKERDLARKVIDKHAAEAREELLAALATPGFAPRPRFAFFDMSAWEFGVRTLARLGEAGILEPCAKLSRNAEAQVRAAAAHSIASLGLDASIEPVRTALRDGSGFVRSSAITGAVAACEAGRATPAFRTAMLESIGAIAAGEVSAEEVRAFARDLADSPRHLAGIDLHRAIEFLQSPRALRADNPWINAVLETLHDAGVKLDAARLLPILHAAKARPAEARWNLAHAQALRCLSRSDPATAAREALEAMRTRSRLVASTARAVAYALRGLPSPDDVESLAKERGEDTLTPAQRQLLAVDRLKAQLRSDGIEAYFGTHTHGECRVALSALEAVGAPRASGIMKLLATRLESIAGAPDTGPEAAREVSSLRSELMRELEVIDAGLVEFATMNKADIVRGFDDPARVAG